MPPQAGSRRRIRTKRPYMRLRGQLFCVRTPQSPRPHTPKLAHTNLATVSIGPTISHFLHSLKLTLILFLKPKLSVDLKHGLPPKMPTHEWQGPKIPKLQVWRPRRHKWNTFQHSKATSTWLGRRSSVFPNEQSVRTTKTANTKKKHMKYCVSLWKMKMELFGWEVSWMGFSN